MPDLTTEVQYIRGIGEKRAQSLARLGIRTLQDLVNFFPRRYEDRRGLVTVAGAEDGASVCLHVTVSAAPVIHRVRRGMELVKLRAFDDTGMADITFFNMPYLRNQLNTGDSLYLFGRVERRGSHVSLTNPVFERENTPPAATRCIVPVYRQTAGVSSRLISSAVRIGLDACGDLLPDPVPPEVARACGLSQVRFAYENIHFPKDPGQMELARYRMIFTELFVLSCALRRMRDSSTKTAGIPFVHRDPEEFYAALPFRPTGDQRKAVAEAAADMASGGVMCRLVQGDVGSGKTLVAAACMWLAWKNGGQTAFMAPTEILAEQHFRTLTHMLSPFGIRVGRLLGGMTAGEKRAAVAQIAAGDWDVIVGTHALISGEVSYPRLSLVITDEQHRFGVEERAALSAKARHPHVLVMSATPIPRTMALILYGDLDLSLIRELPPGRQKVDTFAVGEDMRPRIQAFIRRLAAQGRQVFIVCPMVETEDTAEADTKAVFDYTARLQAEVFPDLRVSCVYGKMKPAEKNRVMAAFAAGEADILVATTVVEVGVDVPNAALMVVENAERFGLSQLHQLRGRVGRGGHKSYCVLFSSAENPEARARLKAMCSTNDGFAIAEEDLRLRGPGDFLGSRQHGLPEMMIADLCSDMDVLESAREAAEALLARDPDLSAPEHAALRAQVEQLLLRAERTFS